MSALPDIPPADRVTALTGHDPLPNHTDPLPGQADPPPNHTDPLPGQADLPPNHTDPPPGQADLLPGQADPLPGADPVPDLEPAPGLLWYLTEPTRAVVDIGQFAATRSLLRAAPRGDGHTVLVLPGLGGADGSTGMLRKFLAGLGYQVHGWGLGRNIGPSVGVVRGMRELLLALAAERPVSLVGWSLGGIFARELAREHPDLVRQVVTLGSPYAMTDLRQTRVNPFYRLLARFYVAGAEMPPPERTRPPFPVPATSVYSKSDGIVAWRTCVWEPGPRRENVAVASSHLGYGYNATVWWVVADRLAQPEGEWSPFTPPPGMARMFPAG